MDNMFKTFDVGLRFDLKGSVLGRTRLKAGQTMYGNRDITVSLKDNDFRMHMHKITFVECLKPDMPNINEVFINDVTFLQNSGLLDYSLLLGELKTDLNDLR